VSLFDRISSWWNKDAREAAEEETQMPQAERDLVDEDYEARKDDSSLRGQYLGGRTTDFERDSERPR
jgi:hypothetical protein